MTDLVTHAHDTRVVVVGGGMAGVVAALECARLGLRVTLIEAGPRLGGSLDRAALGDLTVDAAADGLPASAKTLATLIDEVGLTGDLETARDDELWLGAGPRPGVPGGPISTAFARP